jgi:Tfp pilus assembly protein PilV
MARRSGISSQRGVSLVEALVAMAVMGFGMLAIVGVQSTLRFNADISKQRAEATRLAEQELETVRAFSSIGSGNTTEDEFDAIATTAMTSISGTDWNATYQRTRTVFDTSDDSGRVISRTIYIQVQWEDRTGQMRLVSMHDMITRVDPMLSGFVKAERPLTVIGRRSGRHPTIPGTATNLPGGDSDKSMFLPPNSGNRGWVFNNATGAITHTCTGVTGYAAIDSSTLGNNCTVLSVAGQLISGLIRFNLRGAAQDLGSFSVLKPAADGDVAWVISHSTPRLLTKICPVDAAKPTSLLTASDVISGCTATAAAPYEVAPFEPTDVSHTLNASDSEDPRWPALPAGVEIDFATPTPHRSGISSSSCYADHETLSRLGPAITTPVRYAVQYFCIVIPTSTSGWGGKTVVTPLRFADGNTAKWTIGSTSGSYKVCRYTQASDAYTDNDNHPEYYGVDAASCASTCRPVKGNLVNQNFLVIDGTKSCPTDSAVDPASGNLINSNTLLHQS